MLSIIFRGSLVVRIAYRTAFLWWRLCRDAFEPQAALQLDLAVVGAPFWPASLDRRLPGRPCRGSSLLTSRPFLPPCDVRGRTSRPARRDRVEGRPQAAALDGVDPADELDVDLALQVGDQVGQLVVEERR